MTRPKPTKAETSTIFSREEGSLGDPIDTSSGAIRAEVSDRCLRDSLELFVFGTDWPRKYHLPNAALAVRRKPSSLASAPGPEF